MVSCPGALSFLRSNLTMLMSSFGSTSATSGWLSSLSWIPSLVESSGVNMYGLASTNWLISLRFVSSKLLHSIPSAFPQTRQKVLLCLHWFCCLVLVYRISSFVFLVRENF